jgi:hypothetical protein
MSEWDRLEELLRAQKYAELIEAVRDLGAPDRKALVGPLKEFERRVRDFNERLWHLRSGLSVIGAGVLPGASALAPWLVRNGFWIGTGPYQRAEVRDMVGGVLDVLKARQVPWLPDLAQRLAARLPTRQFDDSLFRLVADLVELTGIDPPPTDGLVFGMASRNTWVMRQNADPRWFALVPRMFEVAGVGRVIDASAHHGGGWPAQIAALAAGGRADRATMIDGAIGAMQRGGRLGDVRGYLKVYEALEPDLSEVAERVRDYVPLLADAHSSVAGVAQQELFRADDAGELEVELLLDGSRAVFLRSEKKLVRAQVERLKAVLGREPGRVDDVLGVLAVLFEHDAADIQAKALDLAIAHASAASQQTKDDLAAAVGALPADLRAKAAQAFGAVDALEATAATLLPATAEPAFSPPISSLPELVEEVEAYQAGFVDGVDMVRLEHLIAGLVKFAHRDRERLRAALDPFFAARWYMKKGHRDWSSLEQWHRPSDHEEMASLIGAAVGPCEGNMSTPYPLANAVVGEPEWRRNAAQSGPPAPERVLVYRLHEISVGLAYAPRPMLVATPTELSGMIDPEVLLERLSQAAADGWDPWEHDLAQALLRLPDQRDAALAARAEALGTDAGKRLAHWLSHECAVTEAGMLGSLLAAPPEVRTWYSANYFVATWPALLPARTELIARHIVPVLHEKTLRGRGGGRLLTALSRTTGQMGDQCARAFAHGLDAHDKNDRAEAVDALLLLAAHDRWNPAVLGQEIGCLAAEVELSLGRVVPCLRDLAQSGAATQVWDTIAASLPLMLSPELDRPPQRLADLLALAVELVEQVRPTTSIPALTALAARRGSSRIVTEAKRLVAALPG